MKRIALFIVILSALISIGCGPSTPREVTSIYQSDFGCVGCNWQMGEIMACEFHTVDGRYGRAGMLLDDAGKTETIFICDEHNALFGYRHDKAILDLDTPPANWRDLIHFSPMQAISRAERYPVAFHGSKPEHAEWQCQRDAKGFDCN